MLRQQQSRSAGLVHSLDAQLRSSCCQKTMSSIKNPLLHRDWVEFNVAPGTAWPPPACGVTAFSVDDALELIQERVYETKPLPPVTRVIEDVDVSQLDRLWHPGIGVPLSFVKGDVSIATPIWRGVWFPFRGHADPRDRQPRAKPE